MEKWGLFYHLGGSFLSGDSHEDPPPTPQSGDGYWLKRGSEMVKVPGEEGAVLGLMRDW